MKKMKVDGKNQYFTSIKPFSKKYSLKNSTILQVFDFSYKMTFGAEGEHRNHRSGGTHKRKLGEIFADTFQGKLSEFAVYNSLFKDFKINVPDLGVWQLGEWDNVDLIANDLRLSIKSTKAFGQLLLLETKDWDNEGRYLPNKEKDEENYDAFILVRIRPYCVDILKKLKLYYSNFADYNKLKDEICSLTWEYDIPGFVWHNELVSAIKDKMIIYQGDMLNEKTRMDAENYYIQAGDLHPLEELKKGKKGGNGES